jgi:hypothetical protein
LTVQESKAYTDRFTQNVVDRFTPIVRESLRQFVNEQVEQRLKSALARDTIETPPAPPQEAPTTPEAHPIVTTQDEIEAYFVVKSILREIVEAKRLYMRDQQSYCGILLDDNNRKPVCRLRFNGGQKFVGLFNEQRIEEKVAIQTVDDLYKFADRLKATVSMYDGKQVTA